ncbi:HDIG domain-containing protein [Candidatus Electrothrix aarhusensis]|uniref:HDIG domain-containing protein n=1 Tax=Candidatus Electrothrix aarhusensis TaxID=1859131 RepID=A0A3S3U6I0_9BACT|nr:HDIG domain-containing protein [Candidatus Electrothrix aarhusensis]
MDVRLNKIIVLLCKSIGQRKIYFSEHPIIREGCQELITELQYFLGEAEREKISIGIADNKLVYEGHYLFGPSIMGLQLVEFARLLHCFGFAFTAGINIREVQCLLDLTDHLAHPVNSLQEAEEFLRSRHVENIQLEAHCAHPSSSSDEDQVGQHGGASEGSGELHSPLLVYQALYDVVAKSFCDASLHNSLDINGTQTMSEHLLNSAGPCFSDILQFVEYPDHDSYTVGHSVRVATLAVFVADTLGVEKNQLVDLGTAALLHDVGKGRIPSEIIYKRGKLNDEEFALMRSHPELGAEILLDHRESTPMQIAAAFGHHIRYAGGGYPAFPPWGARSHFVSLLQICDVFEALTAVRPYKPSITPLAAFGIMINDKGAFDPELLFAFISALGIYPPGSQVRLNNGYLATIVASGKEIDKPKVRITHNEVGVEVKEGSVLVLDLAKETKERIEVAELLVGEQACEANAQGLAAS